MAIGIAAALISVVVAGILSTLIYLPALAVAESLPTSRAGLRGWVWFSALIIPLVIGVGSSALGLTSALTDPYGSPHLTAMRPHLCARWLSALPDGRTWISLAGSCCLAMYAAAFLRIVLTTWRTSHLSRRMRAAASGGDLVMAPDRGVFLATVGLWRPLTVLTSGTQELLEEDELIAALEHESAHGRRFDNLLDAVASCALTCQIVVPTAHLFLRYWREDAERACDDAAASLVGADAVAGALRKLAESARSSARGLSPRPSWTRGADVLRRADRLVALDAQTVEPLGRETALVGAALVIAAIVAVALGVAATAGQATDSLFCLSETMLKVLK